MNNNDKKNDLKKSDDNVLAYGEVTGHAHRVDAEVYEYPNGVREFEGATTITHEEHAAITLPDKKWNSAQVMEFSPLEGMVRPVKD